MKKLLVAIAVVASIGVSLSENNIISTIANYDAVLEMSGGDEELAMDVAAEAYFCNGATLGEAKEL
jgi:hypothetical protein